MYRYDQIAATLAEAGVNTLFGVLGVGNLRLANALAFTHQVRYVAARHEAGAVCMADGFARTTGRLGVCTVTQGPGLTNALTALTATARYGSSVLVLAGEMPTDAPIGVSQQIDQAAMVAPTGARFVRLNQDDDWADETAEAVALALREHRPVVLSLPRNLLNELAPASRLAENTSAPSSNPTAADREALERVADLIEQANRPVVIAGRGAVRSSAGPVLQRLAEHIGAALATTVLAKDLFADDLYSLGIAGGFSLPPAREVLGESDLVLAFGASLNYWTTRSGQLFPHATVVHCDQDLDTLAASGAAVPLHGDAAMTAAALFELVEQVPRRVGLRTAELATQLQTLAPPPIEGLTERSGIDPRWLAADLDQILPRERMLVVDGGHFIGFPVQWMGVPEPDAFVFTLNFGAIGLGIGAAVGAAVARPDRLCVLAAGDGGLMMSLPDLETAIRERLRLLVVVFDDEGYGAEFHHLHHADLPDDLVTFKSPSFAELARSLGAESATVSSREELAAVAPRLSDLRGPFVLHARVDPRVVATWFAERLTPQPSPATRG